MLRRLRLAAIPPLLAALLAAPVPAGAAPEEIRIVRDQFGVPHVYAQTAQGASFGAGYALAQDRLWQLHVFRRIAKGRLSDILGPLVVDIDRTVRFFTYTEEERAARFATYPADIQANLHAFADGINAWIDVVRTDPSKLPFEFAHFGEPLDEDWTVDDSVALGDVLILSFGSGGGDELANAALLADLVDRFGEEQGLQRFDDLVLTNDPDAPASIPTRYPYERRPTLARDAEAEARRGLQDDARLGLEAAAGGTGQAQAATGTLSQLGLIPDVRAAVAQYETLERGLRQLDRVFTFGSNAQIVGSRMSETRNAGQTGGPQVGYLLPQWLADFGIHGGDLDATGMTFAGAGPAVLIGRGPGYAWTTTTGASDLTDTYVERLNPDNPREYEWNGQFEAMDCRTEEYTARGVPFQSEEICRTRHGPVFAFDEANGVAYSLRYAWFNREGQTVEGFFRYNEVQSVEDFATFSNYLSSNHNMFYSDDQGNTGYWHPGNHPVRAPGVDIRLPQDGTGGSEWQGLLPIREVPHAVNLPRGWLTNWNNQPAQPWHREKAHPALDNVIDLQAALDPSGPTLPDPAGGVVNPDRRVDFEDLSANLRYAAFKHHRDTAFRRFLPQAGLSSDLARRAASVILGWDGFLTDRNADGMYDSAGKTIVDHWVARMRTDAFADDLGDLSGSASESLLWHVLASDDRLSLAFDWLGGGTPADLAATAFEDAVAELAVEFDNEDPETWREEVAYEHYQRLNADLFTDLAQGQAGADASSDSAMPGDVPDLIRMDRGTYNHVVTYQARPTGSGLLGQAESKAGSVIPPGQSGFINLLGQEHEHYEDQLALYEQWRYKPMPLGEDAAMALAESVEVITYPGS
ncbi:MAG: penicillin acylase family protein [Actinomycetota bacterium]